MSLKEDRYMTESQLPGTPAAAGSGRALAFPVDQIGVWTSTACVIYCLLTPVVLSISSVSAHFLPFEERTLAPLQWSLVHLEQLRL